MRVLPVTRLAQLPLRRQSARGPLDVAAIERTARELTSPGPTAAPAEREKLVADLRAAAETSVDIVLHTMRLDRDWEDAARNRLADTSVHVVDRLGWVRANGQTFSQLAAEFAPQPTGPLAGFKERSSRQVLSVQLGTVLSVLAGRVLGQYDALGEANRLLLVAPNVLALEQQLGVAPRDFRLWVTVHETTHRVQFALAPWLRDYLLDRVAVIFDDIVKLGDPTQSAVIDEITAVMSLLEGHADVVMDAVGPQVIPSVRTIRRAFDASRRTPDGMRGLLAKVLRIDQKIEQYRAGSAFVKSVLRQRGHAGLAQVFAHADNLPTLAEIAEPGKWLARVPAS